VAGLVSPESSGHVAWFPALLYSGGGGHRCQVSHRDGPRHARCGGARGNRCQQCRLAVCGRFLPAQVKLR